MWAPWFRHVGPHSHKFSYILSKFIYNISSPRILSLSLPASLIKVLIFLLEDNNISKGDRVESAKTVKSHQNGSIPGLDDHPRRLATTTAPINNHFVYFYQIFSSIDNIPKVLINTRHMFALDNTCRILVLSSSFSLGFDPKIKKSRPPPNYPSSVFSKQTEHSSWINNSILRVLSRWS